MSLMITVEQIKKHEGYKQYPYYCTGGKLTIGYGRNLDENGINEEEAEEFAARFTELSYPALVLGKKATFQNHETRLKAAEEIYLKELMAHTDPVEGIHRFRNRS